MPRGPPKGVGVGGGPCVLLFEKALIFGDSPDWVVDRFGR